MWHIMEIGGGMYGFRPEQDRREAWTATAHVRETERRIEVHADVHVTYLESAEQYERLLDAIRLLADCRRGARAGEACVIQYRCRGIARFADRPPLPVFAGAGGMRLVDTAFSERR